MSSQRPANFQLSKQDDAIKRSYQFKKLRRRNIFIGLLRWTVPGVGLLVAGFLIFQIILTNLAKDYGISGLRVEADQVVIDKPRYGGTTPDGTRYSIEAEVARVHSSATDIVNLETATITIEQSDGYKMVSQAQFAQLNLSEQLITTPQLLRTTDSDGVKGVFRDSIIDWAKQTLISRGPVTIEFDDGAIISAQSLFYDASASKWDFGQVKYTLVGDGGL